MRFFTITTAIAVLSASMAQAAAPHEISWEKAYEKSEALVKKLTLEEKAGIVTGIGWEKTDCVGNTYANSEFPSLCLQDGPLGIRWGDNVTAGVSGITAAQSWDKDLLYQRGSYMGRENYLKGIHMALGPCLDIYRAPGAGRGWEGFGEDPYLQGVAAVQTVKGIQDNGVSAVAKHFILNNQETNRKNSSSNADDRTINEVYVWPYARAIEAGLAGVMCSYNQLHGIWACENEYTINSVLKEQLGFKGLVMTDWGAQMSGDPSALAGLDMTMPGDIVMGDGYSWWGANLTAAVEEGRVPESRVDDMVIRIAATYYKLGQDSADFPESTIRSFDRASAPFVDVEADKHVKDVREIGAAAVTILQNDGVLPLNSRKLRRIALVGSDAGPIPQWVHQINNCADQSCAAGTLAMGWGSGTADFPYLITPAEGIKNRAGHRVELLHTYDDYDLETAKYISKDADVAIVFSNTDAGEEYLVVDGNVGDRNNLTLWHNGDNLIKAVADANKNTVVVIHSVGPVLMPWINHPNIKAVVWPGLPGQESGNSLADVLFGDVNPSGRLPYTIAKKESDYGAAIGHEFNIEYTEKLEVGYRHFDAHDIEPLFAFGHGLSYTKFGYSHLKVKVNKGNSETPVSASVTIANTGRLDGAEVAQAYLGFPEEAGEPPKILRGFEKVFIKKGGKTTVNFDFAAIDVSTFDADSQKWVQAKGEFTLYVGASSRDIRQTAKFTL